MHYLIAFDAQNRPATAYMADGVNGWFGTRSEGAKLLNEASKEPDIALSSLSRSLLDRGRNQKPEEERQLKSFLLAPESNEPLSLAVSEAFLGLPSSVTKILFFTQMMR
jgi:hypothetical protein